MMRLRVGFLVICALAGVAGADQATDQKEADRLFAEGRELLTVKNDAKAACEKFEAAIKLDPTATGTMLNLGLCYQNLQRYATSIDWFRKAQASASETKGLEQYRDAATKALEVLGPKVPSVKLEITGAADANITIDGNTIRPQEYGQVFLDPGDHELIGRTVGKKKVVQTISVAEGEKLKPFTVAFTMAATPEYVDRGTGRRKAALIMGAVGIGLYGVTLGFGLWQKSSATDHYAKAETLMGTAREDEIALGDKANDYITYVDTSLFIAATIAVGGAAFLYFTAPGKEQISDGTAFRPVISHDQLGFAVSGGF